MYQITPSLQTFIDADERRIYTVKVLDIDLYSGKQVQCIINLLIKVMIDESFCFICGVFVVNVSSFTISG